VGNSVDSKIIENIRQEVKDSSVMVVLDSSHFYGHVKKELEFYSSIVTSGQFLVLEDVYYWRTADIDEVGKAMKEFIDSGVPFDVLPISEQFMDICITREGWMLRR
jgi:cephalosporin hydroxylase